MAAKEKKIIVMHCDICDDMLNSDHTGEYICFDSKEEAHEGAMNQDWELVDGKWYCNRCIDNL